MDYEIIIKTEYASFEFEDIDEASEFVEFFDNLEDYEQEVFIACYQYQNDIDDTKEHYEEWHKISDYEVDFENGMMDLWLELNYEAQNSPYANYLDSEAIVRDMVIEGFKQVIEGLGVFYSFQY